MRSNVARLEEAAREGGALWCVTLTIPTAGDWSPELGHLWQLWQRLGRTRTAARLGRPCSSPGLTALRLGMGATHFCNRGGEVSPHMHAVLALDEGSDCGAVIEAWQATTKERERGRYVEVAGGGFTTVEVAESVEGAVRYAIDGRPPADDELRKTIAFYLKHKHLVRPIGRPEAR